MGLSLHDFWTPLGAGARIRRLGGESADPGGRPAAMISGNFQVRIFATNLRQGK